MVKFSTRFRQLADDEDDDEDAPSSKRLRPQPSPSPELPERLEAEGRDQQQSRNHAPCPTPLLPSADAAAVPSSIGTHPSADPSSPSNRQGSLFDGAFFDLDTLDCNICMEALYPPIFQCCNGHYCCVDCNLKMSHKCPTCSEPTGRIRNLGLEKIIESLRMRCKYYHHGCTQVLGYVLKKSHEAQCPFIPCNCPVVDCNYQGPSCEFGNHFCKEHHATIIHISYGDCFLAAVHSEDKHVLLKADDQLFLLHAREESYGKLVYLSAFGYSDLERVWSYRMYVDFGTRALSLSSTIEKHQETQNNLNLVDFLVIPRSFYPSDCLLPLRLTIDHPRRSSVHNWS